MKITIVGLGQMGNYYITNLLPLGYTIADIIGVDIQESKREIVRKKYPEMLLASSIAEAPVTDVAIVATSTPSHARVIEELAKRGTRFFFCEKPLGMTVEETDAIRKAVESVGGAVYTAFLINFSAAAAQVLELMENESLVLVEGSVLWGKNRFGDSRPSAGDMEDESVHGAEFLRMFAEVNRAIHRTNVSGHLSYMHFVDQDAQNRAHELDPSFPLEVDSSTFATSTMETDAGQVILHIHSSFLHGEQVRSVRLLLATREDVRRPRYAVHFNFDVKDSGAVVDTLQITDISSKKNLGTQTLSHNKIHDQLVAFQKAIAVEKIDPRLTPFWRARSAVQFTEGIKESHLRHGVPITLFTSGEVRSVA